MAERRARIAFVAPLTGPESVVGVPMMQAVALAVDEANHGRQHHRHLGSLLPCAVELVALDDEANPARARALAARLVEDGEVIGVVGHKNSGPSAAAGSIYAAGGLPQISPSSTFSDLARQGWPTFFRMCADNDLQAVSAARFAVDRLEAVRVAAVHDNSDYGRPLAETFVSTVEKGGAEVVLVEAVQLGQREFDDAVRRLHQAACDLVYFGLTEIESSFLTRALRAAGVTAHLLGADGGRQSPFPRLAGAAAEGVWETYAGQDAQASPGGRAFLQAYEGRFGGRQHHPALECPIFGPEAYDAARVLLEALRRAGAPERKGVLAELKALGGFSGATGDISFEPNGNRHGAQATMWRVVNGAMTPIS